MKNGFTLLELLIVIGILAILATAVTLVLNPAELIKQARDSKRLEETKTIDSALNLYLVSGGNSFGTSSIIYISLPDSSLTCASYSLPSLPFGWLYSCKPEADYRKINGSGWIPVDFTSILNPPLAVLPVDPQNNQDYYYTYVPGGSWAVSSLLESEKYLKQFALTDGGTDSGRFETGSDLQLWSNASGLQGYWKFDETSGTVAADSSGNNNTGTLINNPAWTSGKVNGALSFDGVNDYVSISTFSDISPYNKTVSIWVKSPSFIRSGIIGQQYLAGGTSYKGWGLFWENTNLMRWWIAQGDGTLKQVSESNSLIYNEWTHLVGVYDSSLNKITYYKNGNLINQLTNIVGYTPLGENLLIGTYRSSWLYFNGLIDDVRIYNRALSAAEIQSIYNATK